MMMMRMRMMFYLTDVTIGCRKPGVNPVAHAPVEEAVEIFVFSSVILCECWRLKHPVNISL